jgi:hypothetical protein
MSAEQVRGTDKFHAEADSEAYHLMQLLLSPRSISSVKKKTIKFQLQEQRMAAKENIKRSSS